MNNMNAMNGINAGNPVGAAMAGMKNAANGATPRPVPDQLNSEYKVKLNTYIYDYFLRNGEGQVARALMNSEQMTIATKPLAQGANGLDGGVDSESKSRLIATAKEVDVPLPDLVGEESSDNSFLLDWFTLFWEIFLAPRNRGKNPHAVQYMDHSRVSHIQKNLLYQV